jgi:hypothetical protein
MKVAIRDSDALRAVRPLDLAGYLRAKGWTKASEIDGRAALWTLHDEEILAPFASEVADYHRRVAEAIAVLAQVEDRSEGDVWSDIASAGFDVVRVRAGGEDRAQGTISIEDGVWLFERSRDLLTAAACAAHSPRTVYHTRRPTPAVDYMQRVRLGQTEVGSFVVCLLSPVPPELQPGLPAVDPEDVTDEPFERRVTTTLMQSLSALNRAAGQAMAGGSITPFDETVALGVSANLCEAVVALHQVARTKELEVSMKWAAVRPPGPKAPTSRVRVGRDMVEPLREVARVFREKQPQKAAEVTGYVVKLAREESEMLGHATVWGTVSGLTGHRRVTLELAGQLYEDALHAHRDGEAVRAVGELRREGRGYGLHGVRTLEVGEDVEE